MPNFTANLNITTGRGDKLTATKSGQYNEIFNIRQIVDNTETAISFLSATSTKGAATLPDLKSFIINNIGNVGAEIIVRVFTHTNGTPDTTGSNVFIKYLLGADDFIYFPNLRKMYGSGLNSAATAYALTDEVPDSNMYRAVDNAAEGDAQIIGAEFASSTTAIVLSVEEGAYFYVGDLIRVENEIMEVTSISGDNLTVIRGTHGSTAATHANTTPLRYPFFNAYADFDKYTTVQTDESGRFKATNLIGYGRNTDGSGNRESMGIVAGSFSCKFYESGFCELGLSNITSSTNTGLTASTAYLMDITVDGGTKFQDLTFTTDSSDLSFGKVISLIQDALNTQFYTAGNLFEKRVTVSIVNGDVRFTSGSRLSTSAILIEDTGDANSLFDASAVGRFPAAGSIEAPVAARLPRDTIIDRRSGLESKNISQIAYDDGHGNIRGVGGMQGTLNYETGEILFQSAPANANFVISANYGSSQSGGNKYTANDSNCLTEIFGRSVNAKVDTTIEVIGLQ